MLPLIDQWFFRMVDARAYALVRICVAIAALVNWVQIFGRRHQYLGGSITMLDGDAVGRAIGSERYWSVFHLTQSDLGVTLVCLGAGVAILMMGAGVFANFATALVWAWHVSYSHRMFPVLHSWDAVLRTYTLLLMISPCGTVLSVDAWRRRRRAGPAAVEVCPLVPSYGLALMKWQLAIIYVVTVWLKVPDRSWRGGSLLAYFQMSIYSRTPNLQLFAQHEWMSAVLTYSSLAIEISVVFLLLQRKTRLLGFLLGVGLHVGIGAQATLAVFSLAILAPYPAFLEGRDLEWIRVNALQMTRRLFPTRTSL